MTEGSKYKPALATEPGAVYRATQRVQTPTEAQARAGNYRKGHIRLDGLDIAIESPKDSLREGIALDGSKWSVVMPADYGYIKQTLGADLDQVDVYLGPSIHLATELPVWIVDQIDAETGLFDEHKCLLGFLSVKQAKSTYEAAFSDGKGPNRTGAVAKLTWAQFKQWVNSGKCSAPLFYQKASALKKSNVMSESCSCGGNCFHCASGVTMSKPAEGASPRSLGFVSGLMAKALGAMSPAERKDFVADAAAISASELAKAGEHAINMGEGSNTIGIIEDQWSGPPDDGLTFHRAGGPGTETPSGDVGVGKPQEASGAGAARMEREYSRHARQSGVEEATNRLGRELSKARQAIKALVNFGESISQRMTALESTALSTVPTEPVAKADFDKAIAKAVANMLPDMVRMTAGAVGAALIKSEGESGEEDEEEGEDEEAKEAESGSGTEIEIVNEMDEEDEAESDEDGKAAAKAAAKSRLVAKSLYLLAKRSIRKAKMAEEDKDKKKAMAECRKARTRLAKAVLHLEIAKAVRGNGKPGPSTIGLAKALAKAADEIKPQSINQNKWPVSGNDEVGKGNPPAQVVDATAKSLENQIAEIRKAVEGNGMLTARVEQLMEAIARQPAPGSDNLPPVFALAKAKPDQLTSVEGSINQMAAENKISLDEADRALNVVGMARRGIPTADVMLGTLPLVVQETIKQRLAA